VKPLPPTLREKRRYVLVRIVPPWTPVADPRTLAAEVQAAAASLWGDAGSAEMQPVVVVCDQGHAIIRCRRGTEDRLATTLATVRRVGDHPVALRTVATSGTILSLKERIRPIYTGEEHEVSCGGVHYLARRTGGGRLDLIEKSIKNQKVLFFIQKEVEED